MQLLAKWSCVWINDYINVLSIPKKAIKLLKDLEPFLWNLTRNETAFITHLISL